MPSRNTHPYSKLLWLFKDEIKILVFSFNLCVLFNMTAKLLGHKYLLSCDITT